MTAHRKHAVTAELFTRNMDTIVTVVYHRYWWFIVGALLVTVGSLYLLIGGMFVAGGPKLRVNTDLSSLIPESYKSVQALNQIKEKVSGIDKLEILIQSDDFEASLRFGQHLIPKLMELRNPATNAKNKACRGA